VSAENEKKVEPQTEKSFPGAAENNSGASANTGTAASESGRRNRRERGERGGRGRGRSGERRDKRDRDDARERDYTETLVGVFRCSATVKGGRRLSFGALITVGNNKGRVGYGYAKAKEVPGAIQKATKKAHRSLVPFEISVGDTIPHQVEGTHGASKVILIPARPGTGVIASASVKAILEAGGLKNVLTKCIGNTNSRNVVKATLNALQALRSRELVAKLRQVEL
jgi:small subunit ribosomal protein S5